MYCIIHNTCTWFFRVLTKNNRTSLIFFMCCAFLPLISQTRTIKIPKKKLFPKSGINPVELPIFHLWINLEYSRFRLYSTLFPGRSIRLSDPIGSYFGIIQDPTIRQNSYRIPGDGIISESVGTNPIGLSVGSDSQIRCAKKGVL